jgi:hypothetical protein
MPDVFKKSPIDAVELAKAAARFEKHGQKQIIGISTNKRVVGDENGNNIVFERILHLEDGTSVSVDEKGAKIG